MLAIGDAWLAARAANYLPLNAASHTSDRHQRLCTGAGRLLSSRAFRYAARHFLYTTTYSTRVCTCFVVAVKGEWEAIRADGNCLFDSLAFAAFNGTSDAWFAARGANSQQIRQM